MDPAPYGPDDTDDSENESPENDTDHDPDRPRGHMAGDMFFPLPESFHTLDLSDDPDDSDPATDSDPDPDPDPDPEIEVDGAAERDAGPGEPDLTVDGALKIFETVAAVVDSLENATPGVTSDGAEPDASDVTLIEPGPDPDAYHAGDAFISDLPGHPDPPMAILDSEKFEEALVDRLADPNRHPDQQQRLHEMPGDIDPDTDSDPDGDWQIVVAEGDDVLYSGHIGQWTHFQYVDAGETYRIHEVEIRDDADVDHPDQ